VLKILLKFGKKLLTIIEMFLQYLLKKYLTPYYIFFLLIFINSLEGDNNIKVEPPNWWIHFDDKRLELMIYGKDIGKTETIEILNNKNKKTDLITIVDLKKTDNPNYIFIDLNLSKKLEASDYIFNLYGLSDNTFTYTFKSGDVNRNYANGFNSSDVIYLLMPDRFSNGDPSNDFVEGLRAGTNRSKPGLRHGGDFQGIINHLDYLIELGVTAIWMTPVFINDMPEIAGGYGDHVYGAYHGYAATDFYKTDPRFGTNEKYKELVDAAHNRGLKVVMDIIHNHSGDKHWWIDDPPSSDWYNLNPNYKHTNYEVAVANDPYASDFDLKQLTEAPFVREMPDLNQNNPLLNRYLIQLSYWWIEFSGIDGMRMDTYPYAFKEPMAEWAKRVTSEFPSFNIVGEIWINEPPLAAYWQRGYDSSDGYESYLPSVIDFPFSKAVGEAIGGNANPFDIKELYYTLAQDFVYPEPKQNVIFLDNHDTERFYITMGKDIRRYKIGFALLMITRGIPQMYYGSEINLYGTRKKGDADIRKDFPGGWKEDKRNAFTREGRTKEENEIWDFYSTLLNWRKNNSTIHNGNMMQFTSFNDGVYSLFRYDENRIIGLIINPTDKKISIQTNKFDELTINQKYFRDVIDGQKKKWGDKVSIPSVGFRLIEFDL